MSWVTDSPSKSHVSDTPPSSPLQAVEFSTADEQIDCTLPPPDWDANKSPSSGLTEHITTGDDSPTHSRTAKSLLGKTVQIATVRNNVASLKALGSFCVSKFRRHRKFLEEKCYTEQLLFETRCLLFPDENGSHLPAGHRDWSENQLKVVRFYLIEFVVNYKNLKTGDDIAPTTLKTYMLGIQRGFSCVWDYDLKIFSGPIFACPRERLVGVLDNKARQGQQQGRHVISHDVLSRDELIHLYRSESLSKNTPKGFLTRLVFTVGILTALRPVALATLSVSQFSQLKIGEKFVWKITSAIGSNEGASKTARGGWGAIGQKVPEICVWNEAYNGGTINFYKDIDEYLSIRRTLEVGTDRFFLAINPGATLRSSFFKRQHLGKNSFSNLVKGACLAEGIAGSGHRYWVTTHGLRGTLATLLFENGHSDSSVALRTGHRDPRSLKSYQHLRGGEGIKQQGDILGSTEEKSLKKLKKDSNVVVGNGIDGEGELLPRVPLALIGSVNGGTVNVTINNYHEVSERPDK